MTTKFQEEAEVLSQEEMAHQTYRARLFAPRIAKAARAGQFMMLTVREGLDPLLRRPFSFHRIQPDEGIIEILYRVIGRGTWWLSRHKPGDRLQLLGPLGNGFSIPGDVNGPAVLVAGGIGIAPLFQLLRELGKRAGGSPADQVHLFYGARTAGELLSGETFKGMGISLHISTDDGTRGRKGTVTSLCFEHLEQESIAPAMIYSCGPLAMQVGLARWALAREIPAQLSLESLMACGIGACLGCALPAPHPHDPAAEHYIHVCSDGPIFPAGAIQWSRIQSQQIHVPTFLYS